MTAAANRLMLTHVCTLLADVIYIAFPSQPALAAAEVRREFTFQARRTVSFFLVLLAVCHAFGCLLWIVLRAQHFPEGERKLSQLGLAAAWVAAWRNGSFSPALAALVPANSTVYITSSLLPADTWPVQLNVLYKPVIIQWLWSFFNTISGAIGIGWGPYSPGALLPHISCRVAAAAVNIGCCRFNWVYLLLQLAAGPCSSGSTPPHPPMHLPPSPMPPHFLVVTWPEALVWLFAMLVMSIMFAVLTGYIFSYILAVSAVKQEARGVLWHARLRMT